MSMIYSAAPDIHDSMLPHNVRVKPVGVVGDDGYCVRWVRRAIGACRVRPEWDGRDGHGHVAYVSSWRWETMGVVSIGLGGRWEHVARIPSWPFG